MVGVERWVGIWAPMRDAIDVIEVSDGILKDQHSSVSRHDWRTSTWGQAVDIAVLQLQIKELPNADGQRIWKGLVPLAHILAHLPDERSDISVVAFDGLAGVGLDQGLVPLRLDAAELEQQNGRIMRLRACYCTSDGGYATYARHGRQIDPNGIVAERKCAGVHHADCPASPIVSVPNTGGMERVSECTNLSSAYTQ